MKVKALDTYKRLNVQDNELKRIPEQGEEFDVTKERYKVLTSNNSYNEVFVEAVKEIVETATKKVKTEKAAKSNVKKLK